MPSIYQPLGLSHASTLKPERPREDCRPLGSECPELASRRESGRRSFVRIHPGRVQVVTVYEDASKYNTSI